MKVSKGINSPLELLIVGIVAFLVFGFTHFIVFALVADVCLPAALILFIWNQVEKNKKPKDDK
jgi:hypothetical protein